MAVVRFGARARTPKVRVLQRGVLQRGILSSPIKASLSPKLYPPQTFSNSWNTASSLGALVAPQITTMGIVVLALRSYLVFQNVFITFKTLKRPPPSSRNNGQPSIRALTQRKRDMKGCMAIWIVWVSHVPLVSNKPLTRLFKCCLALYESFVERIVWIFIPFYDELKSVVLIFLILTRARVCTPHRSHGYLVFDLWLECRAYLSPRHSTSSQTLRVDPRRCPRLRSQPWRLRALDSFPPLHRSNFLVVRPISR